MIMKGIDYVNYLKVLGGMLTIISCAGIGFSKSNQYRHEIRNLKDFKRIVIYLRGEISHSNSSLPDIIKTISDKEKGVFEDFLKRLYRELSTVQGKRFCQVWENTIEVSTNKIFLTKPSKEKIKRLGRELGYMDKQTQIECLNCFINDIDEDIREKTQASKDKTRLYNVMGVLFGVFVVIILI